jgi:hypothetical protein
VRFDEETERVLGEVRIPPKLTGCFAGT